MRTHATRETDGPWWHHGRRWWYIGDFVIGIDLVTLRRARFGGARFKLGGKHSEQFASGMIGVPRLFTFYWHVEAPRSWHSKLPDESHVTALEVSTLDHNPAVTATVWKHDDGSWRRSDRWWQRRQKTIYLKKLLWGKPELTKDTLESQAVMVPMPEGSYLADVKIVKATYRFRFGRVKVHHRYELELVDPKYIPVPGKGSQSYNCGPDGLYGQSGPGRYVEDAVADVVRSALRTRRRYAGDYNYCERISD